MNPVNGPVLAALLVALVILVLVVDAQRRVIVRLRESLRCSRSRASVLREKLAIAERSLAFVESATVVDYWPVENNLASFPAAVAGARAADRLAVVEGGA